MRKNTLKTLSRFKLKENSTRARSSGGAKWIIAVTLVSFITSGLLSYASARLLGSLGVALSLIFVAMIVLIGIIADMIGISVAAADETQFHSMAAKRIKGARTSVMLIRHASKVSSFLNDVVGDICGIISGSAMAAIIIVSFSGTVAASHPLPAIVASGLLACITIGGKAAGKNVALRSSNTIVYRTAYILTLIYPETVRRKQKRNE